MKFITILLLVFSINIMTSNAQSSKPDIGVTINHVAISVTDLEESEQFYRDVIGLTQIEEPFGVGRHAWFDIGGGAELHVIRSAEERRERDRNNHLCFSVSSMEHFIERIEANGIDWYDAGGNPGEINVRPDGIQQIYFTDPDGYWIEINDDF
jgi:lactoylglutathione lyase